jgi:hypothetical protein
MSVALDFVRFNLLPGIAAGALMWAVVSLGVWLLRVRQGKLRLCLFAAPLAKSTLVILGVAPALAWRVAPFDAWFASAVPPAIVVPWFLLATGVVLAARAALDRKATARILSSGMDDDPRLERLEQSLDRVLAKLDASPAGLPIKFACEGLPQRPALAVGGAEVTSPTLILEGRPTIVVPGAWMDLVVDDGDLDGAVAHELAHLQIRRPFGCVSSELVRSLSVLNPLAGLMSRQLELEEERACDDVAVAVVGDAQAYAGMLLEGFRFARVGEGVTSSPLRYATRLVGMRPAISERIERVLEREPQEGHGAETVAFLCIWVLLIGVFFSG